MTKQLITHSRQHSFKSCRRRHWWEYEIGLRKETDAKALRMGTAGHAGLEVLGKGGSRGEAEAAVYALYEHVPEGMDEYDWRIEAETVACLVAGYAWRWIEMRLEHLATEQAFRLPLKNPATGAPSTVFELGGKIDGIVRLEDGRLAVLEHKFVSEDISQDSDYWRRLGLDHQISLYVYAARELGHDVDTVLYDVVRKPTIKASPVPLVDDAGLKIVVDADGKRVHNKPKKKADIEAGIPGPPRQTADKEKGYILRTRPMGFTEWGEKLMADLTARPEWYFARQEIARLDSDVWEMRDELWDVQKTLRDAQLKQRWFRTVGRDTCPYCPFFGLCSSRFDPSNGEAPEGFVLLDNKHPELEGTHDGKQ